MSTTNTHRADTLQPASGSTSNLVRSWAAGTGIATLMVTAVYMLATAVSGPLVATDVGEITLGNVIGFTVLGGTIGAGLASVTRRFARRPRMAFLGTALIALVGYGVVPFTAAEAQQTAVWLNVFHVVVAIPVIGLLTRYLPKDPSPAEA